MKDNVFMIIIAFILGAAWGADETNWIITASHSDVYIGTSTNFTLGCVFWYKDKGQSQYPKATIESMQLRHQDNSSAPITVFASMNATTNGNGHFFTSPHDVLTFGDINSIDARRSWFKVKWTVATAQSGGIWKCLTVLYWHTLRYKQISKTVTIPVYNLSLMQSVTRGIDKIKKSLLQLHDEVIFTVNQRDFFDTRHWPVGPFALFRSDLFCPFTRQSYFQSELVLISGPVKSAPKHRTSRNFNSSGLPYFSKSGYSWVYLKFCEMPYDQNAQNTQWPRGSYCINGFPGCPPGFELTSLFFNMREKYVQSTRPHAPFPIRDPKGKSINSMRLNFCCRNDRSPIYSIVLPIGKPFFLYRVGERCQYVNNMNMEAQQLVIDTNPKEIDRYEGNIKLYNLTLNPVQLNFCHYTAMSVPNID